ncbi:chemotaxis protein CheB [Polynucleobacter arcticus]|uniref:protein-glutamate methylesterase n=1 Tax=Polynucleobacter arcticus TaxID=1743165 RepID=A0A6M9PLI4_9BURK|nr:chemotaxis protein CheB [Polynucleobacter arcticus]QKM60178.1 chemotaxis response regulator protein-glutamate methylesterase [Polynucleobacter arcticus]
MSSNDQSIPIRVMLVEDSPLQLHIIKSVLNADPRIVVIGTATNGAEALLLLPKLKPDVICTDYHMPVMDGLEFIQKAVKIFPCPILVLSISVQPDQVDNIFKLLSAGALDVMFKPRATGGVIGQEDGLKLVDKICILNGVKYINKRPSKALPVRDAKCFVPRIVPTRVVVIGASTGGPQAFEKIFLNLKRDFSVPIVCVQHISLGFINGMITWLRGISNLTFEVAKAGGMPMPGHVYFPPERMHLTFAHDGSFVLTEPIAGEIYCPSIDQLLLSAAKIYGSSSVGVLLSGMGRDGAQGMKAIFDEGGDTIAQDEESCVIFGMPAAAIELGVVCEVLSATDIPHYLNKLPSLKTLYGR